MEVSCEIDNALPYEAVFVAAARRLSLLIISKVDETSSIRYIMSRRAIMIESVDEPRRSSVEQF